MGSRFCRGDLIRPLRGHLPHGGRLLVILIPVACCLIPCTKSLIPVACCLIPHYTPFLPSVQRKTGARGADGGVGDAGHQGRGHDGEGEGAIPEAGEVEHLDAILGAGAVGGQQLGATVGAGEGLPGVALGAQALAPQQHPRGAGGGEGVVPQGFGQDFKDHVRRGLAHHVGIDDEGVLLRPARQVVLVGADLVALAGMGPQIHHAEQAHVAHAALEVIGFVFVRHNADAALSRIGLGLVIGDIAAVRLHQQRLEAEIGLQGIVFLYDADT